MGKTPFEAPDINLVEALTAQLMTANRQLEETNRSLRDSEAARIEIFANISHDLRAPLTAIRGALDRLLYAENLDEEDRQSMAAIMDRRVSALEHLVGELYYSVAIEQPNFSLNLKVLPVTPFLEEWFITRQYGGSCDRRELRLEICQDFDAVVEIDPDRMVRVLDNLMENALRFSENGDVITLGCRMAESGGLVDIYLSDTGDGIHPGAIPHIFERTYMGSYSRTPGGKTGSGLGLFIAKTIVEKHGGVIWCESEPKRGSTFFIRVPEFKTKACDGR